MLKHVGRMVRNQRRVIVAYKVVPGEPDNCVVVTTENLEAGDHDALIKLVESPAGQEADEMAAAAPSVAPIADDGVISDEALAKKFRSDADRLSKEAAELRRQAEELVPTKKKAAPKKTAASV
jgi:hypothetical protein